MPAVPLWNSDAVVLHPAGGKTAVVSLFILRGCFYSTMDYGLLRCGAGLNCSDVNHFSVGTNRCGVCSAVHHEEYPRNHGCGLTDAGSSLFLFLYRLPQNHLRDDSQFEGFLFTVIVLAVLYSSICYDGKATVLL